MMENYKPLNCQKLSFIFRKEKTIFLFLITLLSMSHSICQTENSNNNTIPSLESYGYDSLYRDTSNRMSEPVGIAIICYNRPHYLAQLVKSLEQNPEAQTLPFYFFLDGGPRAKQTENADLIQKSSIKHKNIIFRPRNYGCPKNQIDALRFMFDWCGYSKTILFEEDLMVSPSYIELTLNLHKWATDNYHNVGMVSCWSYCFLDREIKAKRLDWVREPLHWWSFVTYCLDKKFWDGTKHILYEYESFLDEIPHTEEFARARSKVESWKDAWKIKAWIKSLVQQKLVARTQGTTNFPELLRLREKDKKAFSCPHTYKAIEGLYTSKECWIELDNMMALILWMADYVKIETVVNRAIHVGNDEGISMHPGLVQQLGLDRMKLDVFDQDKYLFTFKP